MIQGDTVEIRCNVSKTSQQIGVLLRYLKGFAGRVPQPCLYKIFVTKLDHNLLHLQIILFRIDGIADCNNVEQRGGYVPDRK